MTKIDFYITPYSDRQEYLTFACRLTEKAWRKQHNVCLHTDSVATSQQLDDLLWTFRNHSFLPHRRDDQQDQESTAIRTEPDILISSIAEANSADTSDAEPVSSIDQHHDVLVNLSNQLPQFFSRFERVAEVVIDNEQAKAQSRERYKFYRDRGYELAIHKI